MARKKDSNSSDWMSRKQDEQLEQMEKNLSALYADAAKEVNKEFTKFTDTFNKQQTAKLKELEEGLITDAEYQVWVQKQVLHTDMYKATIGKLTDTLVKADKAAMAVVNGKLPSVVAQSYNFTQALGWASAQKSGLSMGTFQVYNARSVQSLLKGSKIMKDVDVPEDTKWNRDKINKAITTSILKGDSIPKTADSLQGVTNMDRNAAIRNARTCMTAAENLGRTDSAEDLKAKGVPIDEVWFCVHDTRTRETHILLDGTKRDEITGKFGEGILDNPLLYPADPEGDPEEIYNCRCRLSIVLQGIDHSNDDELYKQFMMENDPESYEAFKDKDEAKEAAFQARREAAEERLAERQAEQAKEKEPEFVPAKTIEAAEKYAKDNFVVDSRWAGEGKVSFAGMSLDHANAINKELTSLFNNTDVPKFRNIGMMNFRQNIFKDSKDAPMAYRGMFNGDLFFNPKILKDQKSLDSYWKKGNEAFNYCINNLDKFSGSQLDLVLRYKEAGRQVVAESCDNKVKAMLDHEFGHHIDHQILRTNSNYVKTVKDGMDKYGRKLSGYSSHSSGEYVAESYCAYVNNAGNIDPELRKIFDGIRRKK